MDKLNILDCGNYITIVNLEGDKENHCHLNKGDKEKQLKTARMLVKLVQKRRVPKSPYLRECALRISLDERYIQNIQIKIEKDLDKQMYYNANRGLR